VLVPVIAPYATSREKARAAHAELGIPFVEMYVAAPVEVCADRDVKGLYAKQRAGLLTGLTGVDDPYEPPTSPDLVLPTHAESADASIAAAYAHLMP
jgi:adenylylsulfate kinase